MRFVVVKINALLCFLNGLDNAIPVFIYYLVSSNIDNGLYTFQKVKKVYYSIEILLLPVYKQYTCSK